MSERLQSIHERRQERRRAANQMWYPAIGVVGEEVARNFAVAATFNEQLPLAENIALHYTGDFSIFVFAHVLESTIFSRIDNTALRRGLSVGLPAAGMTILETAKIIGSPDPLQLPAGYLGLLAYWGLRSYFEHRAGNVAKRTKKK